MNSHILKTLLAAALVAGATSAATAQELKIGYVNSDRVLRDAAPAKAAQAKLEAEFSKREKDLTELANRLKAASDRGDWVGTPGEILRRLRAPHAVAPKMAPGLGTLTLLLPDMPQQRPWRRGSANRGRHA